MTSSGYQLNQPYANKPLPNINPQMQQRQMQQQQQQQQQHHHQYNPQQNHYQQQQPPYQQYNHQTLYQQGSPNEQQYQQQQYQQYQNVVQQQQYQYGRSTNAAVQSSLKDWFDAVDTDRSGSLSCEELQRALMNVETVRLMMNMFDRDNDGTISFNEFIGLWNYIEKWKACFQTYDLDGSGTIDAMELQKALRGFGYNLSESTVSLIVTKYDVRGRGDISFDNFVQSCVTVQTLTDSFRRIDVAGTGVVTMTYEQVCNQSVRPVGPNFIHVSL
ncbi:Alpha-1 3/1 6-mannosyltransferase alg-2 [Entomortierella beljakovae]|nr:Alpha-1 3/1 6-mannosyltransferase alg-2 [Entomortierella beljakovae]